MGLGSSVHDPSIAFVGDDGEVLFAEAVERAAGTKRAWHMPPDDPMRVDRLLDRYAPRGTAVTIAHSWERRRWRGPLFRAGYLMFGERLSPLLRPTALGQMNAFDAAGLQLRYRLHERGDEGSAVERHFDHHSTHAAYAAMASGWTHAACAVIDANGERSSESFFAWRGGKLEPLGGTRRKAFGRNGSLGAFYAALTVACGFDPIRGEEWKVMGLAPYGDRDERLYQRLRAMMHVDGLRLRGDSYRVIDELTAMRRTDPDPLAAADLARTGQIVFGEWLQDLLHELHLAYPSERLLLCGGCALNSSFNGEVLERTPFRELFVPSAPADDGNAIGAARLALLEDDPHAPSPPAPLSPFLGSALEHAEIELTPSVTGVDAVAERAALLLSESKIVAVAQGRAEFGPRALGNRSILADPRDGAIKDRLNASVKRREGYRPFAPAVLHGHGDAWFERYAFSPYMERTLPVRPEMRSKIPGVVHVDGTGRLQSVTAAMHPNLHRILARFFARTGVPVLLNTSFNVMGKPIVHSVEDALGVFFTSGIDALVIEDRLYEKPGVSTRPASQ